jgi:hypothetical protein
MNALSVRLEQLLIDGMKHKMHEVLIGQSYYLRFDPKLWEQCSLIRR